MIIGRIRFLASAIAPKPEEVDYWIDLQEDPYGFVIKSYNGIEWKKLDYRLFSKLLNHINNKSNPHAVTKEQVGLGNVDNTSDLDKPISTATQTELDKKQNAIESVEINVNDGVGTPSGEVEFDGYKLVFTFSDIKGEQGEIGPQGLQGNSGVTGVPEDLVVVNNLDGGESEVGAIKVLAAEQGKVLNEKHVVLTEEQYDSLYEINPDKFYYIIEDDI